MMQNIKDFHKTNNEALIAKNFNIGSHNLSNRQPLNRQIITPDQKTTKPFTSARKDMLVTNASTLRYDKHEERLAKGEIDDNQYYEKFSHRITRIVIDSAYRVVIPKNVIDSDSCQLTNPFSLTKNSSIVTIKMDNHGFIEDDKIIIDNVMGEEFYLKQFEFESGSNFVKIIHPNHGMTIFDETLIHDQYRIKIENISINDQTYIENIPVNILNNFHTVYFNKDGTNTVNPNHYFIQLPLNASINETYNVNYKVIFQHLYGLPIPKINANYPITSDRNQGFHIVQSIIDDNTFTINTNLIANNTISNVGGDYISIAKITKTLEGYPDNNHYIIDLNKTYYNVDKIRLISTEMPNTDKVIRDYPEIRRNNRLYWNIIDDGDITYSIDITPGNYDVDSLINELKAQISKIERVNTLQLTDTEDITYLKTMLADININVSTSVFDIQFFSEIIAEDPFTIVQDNLVTGNIFFLEVKHPNHLLQAGTQILIQDSLDIGFLPASIINALHTIDSVIDDETYRIRLPKFNKLNTQDVSTNGGGVAVSIRYPLRARLLFDRPGTCGNILGFRKTGEFNSVTEWNYTVTNNEPYVNDILVDSVGNELTSANINNYINLNGDDYILLANPLFKNNENVGVVKDVFAKILLGGLPGYVIYDQFVQIGEVFEDTISSLNELEFTFYTKDGELYYFNGQDHSFTIEIYEKIYESTQLNNSTRNEKLQKDFHKNFDLHILSNKDI